MKKIIQSFQLTDNDKLLNVKVRVHMSDNSHLVTDLVW